MTGPTYMRSNRGEAAGFSLIEMLVALAALGLALGALYQAASGATRNARLATDYAMATTLAESMLDEMVVQRPAVGVTDSGAFEQFSWQAWVEAVPEREDAGIAWVSVEVTWQDDGRGRVVTLRTVGRSDNATSSSI